MDLLYSFRSKLKFFGCLVDQSGELFVQIATCDWQPFRFFTDVDIVIPLRRPYSSSVLLCKIVGCDLLYRVFILGAVFFPAHVHCIDYILDNTSQAIQLVK